MSMYMYCMSHIPAKVCSSSAQATECDDLQIISNFAPRKAINLSAKSKFASLHIFVSCQTKASSLCCWTEIIHYQSIILHYPFISVPSGSTNPANLYQLVVFEYFWSSTGHGLQVSTSTFWCQSETSTPWWQCCVAGCRPRDYSFNVGDGEFQDWKHLLKLWNNIALTLQGKCNSKSMSNHIDNNRMMSTESRDLQWSQLKFAVKSPERWCNLNTWPTSWIIIIATCIPQAFPESLNQRRP